MQIRLYILQGYNLAGRDDDHLSDPYLIVKIGSTEISTHERHKKDTRDPKFFECFEFTSKLPGTNDILISVMDYNSIYTDELIGSTVIDLEDRFVLLCINILFWYWRSKFQPKSPLKSHDIHLLTA